MIPTMKFQNKNSRLKWPHFNSDRFKFHWQAIVLPNFDYPNGRNQTGSSQSWTQTLINLKTLESCCGFVSAVCDYNKKIIRSCSLVQVLNITIIINVFKAQLRTWWVGFEHDKSCWTLKALGYSNHIVTSVFVHWMNPGCLPVTPEQPANEKQWFQSVDQISHPSFSRQPSAAVYIKTKV